MDYEILAYNEEIGTAHDDEAATIELEGIAAMSKPIIETAKDSPNANSSSSNVIEQEKPNKSDIPIPSYLKDTDTKKVVEYEEK